MAINEATWKARMLEKAENVAPQRTINEAYLRQAAVDAELLTNQPAWDKYLQRLQVDLDGAKANLQAWREKVHEAYTEADLRATQLQIAVFHDRVNTLRYCMTLPKEILAHAHDTLDNASK